MWQFNITNIAGIRSGQTSLESGVNIVQAENWQGKSSLLAAIQTVMGTTGMDAERHPLTEGASKGRVELDTGSETYVTRLCRDAEAQVARTSDTYLTDETDRVCARLFAFLGEDNPVRAAVRNGDDLAELLRRPLDLENIDERINTLKTERRRVEQELEKAESAAEKLPALEETITELEQDLESLRERRADTKADAAEDDHADLRDQLSEQRAALDRVETDVERLRNRIERTGEKLEAKREELSRLEIPDEPVVAAEVENKRDRIKTLDRQIGLLGDVYSANKRVLDENQVDLVTTVERSIAGDELACWVCGAPTTAADLSERLDALQREIQSRRTELDNLEAEIQEMEQRREKAEAKRRTRDRLKSEIADLETDLEADDQELEAKRERRDALAKEVEEIEVRLEDAATDVSAELADVESKISIAERNLSDRREEHERLKDRSEQTDQLREQRDALTTEIETLRDRKRTKLYELKEEFDAAMREVIDTFEPGFENARLDPKTTPDGEVESYDLVVARDGRQARLNALSEGEVELVGIVTALAGYKTFDVGQRVPVLLLDGIGQLAGTHVHRLVDYLSDKAEIVVTTAYPEAGDFDGHTLTPEEWDVVSEGPSAPT